MSASSALRTKCSRLVAHVYAPDGKIVAICRQSRLFAAAMARIAHAMGRHIGRDAALAALAILAARAAAPTPGRREGVWGRGQGR